MRSRHHHRRSLRSNSPIYSTVSGIVTERKVTQGQYVNAGEVLFTVTDLSTIWVKADVYQPDLPSVHTGQSVEITSDSLPGTTLHGRVGFLDTSINPQTRTASARIEVPNPSMRFRPGMFVQVKFAAPAGRDVLAIPRSAVLDTGTRKIVYVAKGNGEFEGRQVQLGPPGNGLLPRAYRPQGRRTHRQPGQFSDRLPNSNHRGYDRDVMADRRNSIMVSPTKVRHKRPPFLRLSSPSVLIRKHLAAIPMRRCM